MAEAEDKTPTEALQASLAEQLLANKNLSDENNRLIKEAQYMRSRITNYEAQINHHIKVITNLIDKDETIYKQSDVIQQLKQQISKKADLINKN